jgi:hypothetical protein
LNKLLFVIFSFSFTYGLFVALGSTLDAIRFALTRVDYLNKSKNNNSKN